LRPAGQFAVGDITSAWICFSPGVSCSNGQGKGSRFAGAGLACRSRPHFQHARDDAVWMGWLGDKKLGDGPHQSGAGQGLKKFSVIKTPYR